MAKPCSVIKHPLITAKVQLMLRVATEKITHKTAPNTPSHGEVFIYNGPTDGWMQDGFEWKPGSKNVLKNLEEPMVVQTSFQISDAGDSNLKRYAYYFEADPSKVLVHYLEDESKAEDGNEHSYAQVSTGRTIAEILESEEVRTILVKGELPVIEMQVQS